MRAEEAPLSLDPGYCLTEILLQMFVNGLAPETISQPSPAAAGQNGSANVSFIEFHQQSSPPLSGQSPT